MMSTFGKVLLKRRTMDQIAIAQRDPIVEFTVILGNEDNWLSQFTRMLSMHGNFVLGMMCQRYLNYSVVHFVTESPQDVRELLNVHGVKFSESTVIVVRARGLDQLDNIFRTLVNNEVLLHYCYSLMSLSSESYNLVMRVDNDAMAIGALTKANFVVLSPSDLCR